MQKRYVVLPIRIEREGSRRRELVMAYILKKDFVEAVRQTIFSKNIFDYLKFMLEKKK